MPDRSTADEALERLLDAVLRGDTARLIGCALPEAFAALPLLQLSGHDAVRGWQVIGLEHGTVEATHRLYLGDDSARALRLTWRRTGAVWKVQSITPVEPRLEAERQAEALGGPLDLTWLAASTERLARPVLDGHGLTLAAINRGSYGTAPARATSRSLKPRGAAAATAPPTFAITVVERAEVWSPDAARLYEEAVARRWRPALDIPWAELTERGDVAERAICQLCTTLSEYASVACDAPAAWQHRIAYDFHEVKLFLATQSFDAARHGEAFRKRALAVGGGLGVQTPGHLVRRALDAQSYAELSLSVHVVLAGQIEMLLAAGAMAAGNRADGRLFGLALQDTARWLAYGASRLQAQLAEEPAARPAVETILDRAEAALAADLNRDEALTWALETLIGADGRRALRGRAVRRYLARLAWAGIDDRADRLDPRLAAAVD